MLPINYHHLYYFWIIAKSGSISIARERLLLSQPTISTQIALLEKGLKTRLFIRSRSGMTLTQEGSLLLGYCNKIFSLGDEMLHALEDNRHGSQATFRLGFHKSISRQFVLEIINHLQHVAPELQVYIYSGSSAELSVKLRDYNLCMAITYEDISHSHSEEIKACLISKVPVIFVASPMLAAKVKKFPHDMEGRPLLVRTAEDPLARDIAVFFEHHRVHPRIVAETEDSELLHTLAIKGKGIVGLNISSVRDDLRSRRLLKVNRTATGLTRDIWFSAPRHPHPNRKIAEIVKELMTAHNFVLE